MLRAMDSAVAGLRAHQNKLDVIGHNIANVNTFGFKSQSYSFQEAMYQTSSSSTRGNAGAAASGGTNAAQYGYGSLTGSISTDMGSSTPTYVGGLNASINGEGFFVTSADLKTGVSPTNLKGIGVDFTRVGQFNIDGNGYLVDSNGNFVYGYRPNNVQDYSQGHSANLEALKIPSATTGANFVGNPLELKDVKINSLGEVTGTDKATGQTVSLGKVAVATFQNPEGLTKTGQFYYNAEQNDNTGTCSAAEPGGTTSTLMTGYIEASNVDLAKEFSEMITTQRGFQANSKIITVSDEILNDLINMKR